MKAVDLDQAMNYRYMTTGTLCIMEVFESYATMFVVLGWCISGRGSHKRGPHKAYPADF